MEAFKTLLLGTPPTRTYTADATGLLTSANNLSDVADATTAWNNIANGNRTVGGNLTVSGGTAEITTASGTAKANIYATSTTDIAQLDLKTGNGTTSGRTSRVLFRTDETSPQRWDAGMGGTKQWIVADSTNARNNIVISDTTGGVAVLGTNTNDNASTGYVGEYVESTVAAGSAVSLTTGTATNVTSISLGAGDWDVSAVVAFVEVSPITGAQLIAGVSTTSATRAGWPTEAYSPTMPTSSTSITLTPARRRLSLSGTTTVYLIGQAAFSAGAVSAFGHINARRVR